MENPAHVHYLFYRQFCKMLFIWVISCQLSNKNTKITLILYTYYSYVWTYYWFKEFHCIHAMYEHIIGPGSVHCIHTMHEHIIGSGSVLLLHLLLWTCRLREKLYISQGTKNIKNKVNLCLILIHRPSNKVRISWLCTER